MSRERNGQTNAARQNRPDRNGSDRNGSDRIGQTEKSCSGQLGQLPTRKLPTGQLPTAMVLVGRCPSSQLSWLVIVQVGSCPRWQMSVGSCPRTYFRIFGIHFVFFYWNMRFCSLQYLHYHKVMAVLSSACIQFVYLCKTIRDLDFNIC